MGRLTFPASQLRSLFADAVQRWPNGVRDTFLQSATNEKAVPAFWLVGDEGVYIMHNANLDDGDKPVIVYARECDPTTMDTDDWWSIKEDTFGGDDGVELLDVGDLLPVVDAGSDLWIDFVADGYVLSFDGNDQTDTFLSGERVIDPGTVPGGTLQ